jgi:glycosyltransferase involved in cell wall biosynthesis
MKKLIEKELKSEKYDLIHVETFYVYQNLPKTHLPVVLAEHNIEYLVYQRYISRLPLLAKPLGKLDVLKIKKEEEKFWKKADKLVAVSQSDKKLMGREDAVLVPNGVDLKKFENKRKIKKSPRDYKVLFIGNFKWIQNTDALTFIIRDIWPKIQETAKSKNLNIKLWVVGKKIPQRLKILGDETIHFDENAPDQTELIYKEADLLLAPIRVGGGTSFKILESMATGLPVATTSLGNEGIDGIPEKDLLICESSEEFARATIDILTDDKKYRQISQNAQNFIKNNFGWENITKKLEEVYQSLK